ncbi:hypothetical protein FIBSPDRAFT_345470 [Athelia psychrophila]|uniref:Uncharacterized protein n=1 Tax=Athelia psychrophila TaxID=1759441 RepID=A0A166PUA6_9AGAM|nr:hypothetical protein FIBSPDRAFT_345470 [Fibularhizoctonia sp. CBS 109695]
MGLHGKSRVGHGKTKVVVMAGSLLPDRTAAPLLSNTHDIPLPHDPCFPIHPTKSFHHLGALPTTGKLNSENPGVRNLKPGGEVHACWCCYRRIIFGLDMCARARSFSNPPMRPAPSLASRCLLHRGAKTRCRHEQGAEIGVIVGLPLSWCSGWRCSSAKTSEKSTAWPGRTLWDMTSPSA